MRDNSVSPGNLHKAPATTGTREIKGFTNTQRGTSSQAGRRGQRGLGLIPKQRVKEGVNLGLEMLVCITHRITASPGEAQRDGPSLPASSSLSGPAGHLQGQKPSFPLSFFFFPLTQSLASLPCQSTETAGMMHRLRSVRPDTSVIVAEVWMKLPQPEMLLFSLCTIGFVHFLLGFSPEKLPAVSSLP